jgi:hypothetical protein
MSFSVHEILSNSSNYMLQLSFHMTATSTFCSNPSNKFQGTSLLKQRYMKNTSCIHRLSSSRSFTCRFIPFKLWVASSMDGFIRTRYKDRKSGEHVKVLKQEAFVDRSSEFQAKFLLQEVESTLNQLVRDPCHSQVTTTCYLGFYQSRLFFLSTKISD